MPDIVYAIIAGLLFALMGLGYKAAERRACGFLPFTISFSLAACLITGAAAILEGAAWADPRFWVLGIVIVLTLFAAIHTLMAANRAAPASVSWTVLNLSIILPILIAPIAFAEPFCRADPGIIVFFILMLLCFAKGIKGQTGNQDGGPDSVLKKALLPLGLLFLANGSFNLGNKVKASIFGDTNNAGIALVLYSTVTIIAVAGYLAKRPKPGIRGGEFKFGAYTGACSCLGSLFFLRAMTLPAAIVFPVTCGISLLGGVALTTIFYHEKMNRWKIAGIGIGCLTMAGAIFREGI